MCSGFEPGATIWKAPINPLSYGGPHLLCLNGKTKGKAVKNLTSTHILLNTTLKGTTVIQKQVQKQIWVGALV